MSSAIPLDASHVARKFRLASYVPLSLACVALVWAEYDLVPVSLVIAGMMAPLIVLAYVAEDRWSMPSWASNVLGLAIGGVALCWLVYESIRPDNNEPL